jgi:hypothetical protein
MPFVYGTHLSELKMRLEFDGFSQEKNLQKWFSLFFGNINYPKAY